MMAMEPGGDGYFTARTLAPSHRGTNRQFSSMSKNGRNKRSTTISDLFESYFGDWREYPNTGIPFLFYDIFVQIWNGNL